MKIPLRFFAVASVIVVISLLFFTSQTEVNAYSSGAPTKQTGSPGDGSNCTSCHSGTPQLVMGLISSTVPVSGYIGGQTYAVTATLVSASVNTFGFEISPQNAAGTLLGSMTLTDATRTQLIGSGKWITHTSSGNTGAGNITWSFNWKAPVTGTGNVTFYGAFNFSNSDGMPTGDTIKLCQLAVIENTGAGIDFISEKDQIILWPNPVHDIVHLSSSPLLWRGAGGEASIHIFDSSGKIIRQLNIDSENIEINLSDVAGGIYFISLNTNQGNYSYKLYKL